MFVASIVLYNKFKSDFSSSSGSDNYVNLGKKEFLLILLSFGLSLLSCFLWVHLIKKHPVGLIKAGFGLSLACQIMFIIFAFSQGQVILGVIFLVLLGFQLLWWRLVQDRIK